MPSEWGIRTSPSDAGDCRTLEIAGRGPFPSSIEGENRRALERRGEERAGRVGDVVLDEMPLIGTIRARALEAEPRGGAGRRWRDGAAR